MHKTIEEHLRAIFRQVSQIATEELQAAKEPVKKRAAKTRPKRAAKKRGRGDKPLSMTPGAIRIRAMREAARAKLAARTKKEPGNDPAEGVF